MPLITDHIAEQERGLNLGGDPARAIDRGEPAEAREPWSAMGAELRSHWQEEERLFPVMGRDEPFAEHMAPRVREHRGLQELVGRVGLSVPAWSAHP